jgi:tetratricopeptide (TPR) repeat protein
MTRRKARVSLSMIVRDEEHNLGDCLRPVADLFDEIVIVDTGSRDGTRSVARQFTPHVHDFAWCDDFSAARNESLRHTTGDWIFWLDADDRIRPENVLGLRRALDDLGEQPMMVAMETVLPPAHSGEDARFVTHPRLFRRHAQLRWEGRVHEQLQYASLGYPLLFTDIQIDHIGYLDPVLQGPKARRKLRLLQMDYAVNPDHPSTLLHLGMSLVHTKKIGEARRHLLRLVAMNLGRANYMRWVYQVLAELSLKEGRPAEASEFAARGLLAFPDDEQLQLVQAMALYVQEKYGAAAQALFSLIHSQSSRHMHFCSTCNTRRLVAPRMLGVVQRMQKVYSDAEATLKSVLRDFPSDINAWYNLGLVYLDIGNGQRLAPVVHQLQTLPRGHLDAGLLAALWQMRHGELAMAGPIIDQLIAEAPDWPRPRMLWAEWLSRRQAPWETQMQALRDVLRLQPGNLEAESWIQAVKRVQAPPAPIAASQWFTSDVSMPGVAIG